MTPPGAGKEGESSPFESPSGIDSGQSDGAAQCTTTPSDQNLGQASPRTTDSNFDRLCVLIQGLPQELFDKIQETVYELAFCPGFAFPHRQTNQGTYEWNGILYNTTRPQLLSISKAVLAKYSTKIFSENLFVVGSGMTQHTLCFLGIGWRHPLPIRRAYASFRYRDLGEDWAKLLPICEAIPTEEDWVNLPYLKQKRHLESFDTRNDRSHRAAETKLIGLWSAKYWRLRQLPLDELTLDFTECYGGYNTFLGIFAAQILRLRALSAPPGLRVIAPYDSQRLHIQGLLTGVWA
ncbi:MAG: hypothetical protein L6R42_004090 [Xanthoria sp. 1 TBL-2021]|nr:MAG: hypothetical protein L6R42_004090 [Xanthoria sp. 1 TBL-2021]